MMRKLLLALALLMLPMAANATVCPVVPFVFSNGPNPDIAAQLNSNFDAIRTCAQGIGNVTGPGPTTTVSDIACWDDTDGSFLKSCGGTSVVAELPAGVSAGASAFITGALSSDPAFSPNQIYKWVLCTDGTCIHTLTSAGQGTTVQSSGATELKAGLAGYILNQNPNGFTSLAQGVAVAAYGVGSVNGSATWGFNSLLSDNEYLTTTGARTAATALYNEFDFNISSTFTIGAGLMVGGTWLVQPAGVNGMAVTTPWGANLAGPSAPFAKWANGFIAADGCCLTGMTLGTQTYTATASDPSQPLVLSYRESGAVLRNQSIIGFNDAVYFGGSDAWGIVISDGGSNASAFQTGATAGSGANVESHKILLNWRDGASASQNYSIAVTTAGQVEFQTTATGLGAYLFNGEIMVPNASITGATGLWLGATAVTGANTASYNQLFNYRDSGNVAQNYSIGANASGSLVFAGTAGTSTALFDFEGQISVKGNPGVSCSGAPSGGFTTVNGVVTVC